MNLEVVSYDRDHHSEASVKVSSRCNSRKPVKTPPVFQVSPWSLGGYWGSWWTWSWCYVSRFHLSYKSLPGVYQNTCTKDEISSLKSDFTELNYVFPEFNSVLFGNHEGENIPSFQNNILLFLDGILFFHNWILIKLHLILMKLDFVLINLHFIMLKLKYLILI